MTLMTHDFVKGARHGVALRDLDAFTQGYIEALFFTEGLDPDDELYELGFFDFDANSLQQIIRDCMEFQTKYASLLAFTYQVDDYNEERAGHDLWFTRHGHGVGYWDRGFPKELGNRLSDFARGMKETWPYAGDDGLIYVSH